MEKCTKTGYNGLIVKGKCLNGQNYFLNGRIQNMRMTKKVTAMALASMMALSLAGCGGSSSTTATTAAATEAATTAAAAASEAATTAAEAAGTTDVADKKVGCKDRVPHHTAAADLRPWNRRDRSRQREGDLPAFRFRSGCHAEGWCGRTVLH